MAFYTLAEKAEVTSSLVVSQIAKVADKTSVPLSRRVDLVSFKEGKRQIEIVKKRTDSELALSEICHLDHLANTRIYSNVPKVIRIDILRGSQWDLYLSKAPGIAMSDLVKQANLTQLERGFFRLGQALGEMDIKECGPLDSFELKVISKLPERYQFVQKSLQEEYNLRLPLSHKEIVEITRHFKSTSSRAFLSHDDPSLGNFMWDSKTNQITVFDIGTIDVTSGSKFIQNPRGYAFYNLLLEIDEEMAANPARSLSIKKAYIKGYEEISGLSFREDEYMRIYTLIEKITGALDNEVSKQEMQSILRSLSTPLA
jgi:aminoglycoside phosphotransferase